MFRYCLEEDTGSQGLKENAKKDDVLVLAPEKAEKRKDTYRDLDNELHAAIRNLEDEDGKKKNDTKNRNVQKKQLPAPLTMSNCCFMLNRVSQRYRSQVVMVFFATIALAGHHGDPRLASMAQGERG